VSFESALDTAIRVLRQRRMRKAMVSPQLKKGIAVESEHAATVKKIQRNPKMPAKKAAALIAKDHLKEDPAYYEKLAIVEGKVKKQRGLKAPRIKLIGMRGKVKIYRVDDTKVRKIYPDWTMGGHDVTYDFVPRNEVWIAGELGPPRPPLEETLTQLHELRERRRMIELMSKGMSRSDAYDKAHDESLAVEDKYRKANGRGLKAALQRESGQVRSLGGKRRHASQEESRGAWRSVVNPKGRGFASWVRALKGKSGAYLIRSDSTGEYIYAGESHTGNLSRTLVRHFYSSWSRRRRGRHPENRAEGGEMPGYIYDRDRYEVRVEMTDRDRAVSLQNEWIAKYDPRDNRIGGDVVPF
jgi:hypothetical protein